MMEHLNFTITNHPITVSEIINETNRIVGHTAMYFF
jgi:hypothetical protein